jgi:hypothetical protein
MNGGIPMNRLPEKLAEGALGEIFVQLKLLQYGVQAAPPIKDSGNDLIAIKGEVFRAIQVKTTVKEDFTFDRNELPNHYHLLALVKLIGDNSEVDWTKSRIYLLSKDQVQKGHYTENELEKYCLSQDALNNIFRKNSSASSSNGRPVARSESVS